MKLWSYEVKELRSKGVKTIALLILIQRLIASEVIFLIFNS